MAITVINTVKSQALRGQTVKVTLSKSEQAAYLHLISVGDQCTNTDGDRVGFVRRVDTEGNSFTVTPENPELTFESDTTPGFLNSSQNITVDI